MTHPITPKVAHIHLEYTVPVDDYLKMFKKREEIPTQKDYDDWCRSQAEDYFSIMLSGDEIRLRSTTEITTKLVDNYVNFIIDGMSQKLKKEMLYEFLVNKYKDLSKEELTQKIRENYGDEWFEEHN